MKIRDACLQFARLLSAIVAYAFLAAFVALVGTQIYGWFRTGDWTHIGVNDGLRAVLARCCARHGDGDLGRFQLHEVQGAGAEQDWPGARNITELHAEWLRRTILRAPPGTEAPGCRPTRLLRRPSPAGRTQPESPSTGRRGAVRPPGGQAI